MVHISLIIFKWEKISQFYIVHFNINFGSFLTNWYVNLQETDGLNSEKRKLEAEIMALKDKKKELEDMLKTHDCILVVNSSDDEESKQS